jgi:hypothetical protein
MRARRNPIGLPAPPEHVVRLGEGAHTHFYRSDPMRPPTLCGSGAHLADPLEGQAVYRTAANYVTCYRCVKLGEMNKAAGRQPWDPGPRKGN